MRFLIAAVLFVASMTSLLLGVGDRTIWAPEPDHHLTLEVDSKSPYVLVPAAALHVYGGVPVLKAVAEDSAAQVFVAYGRESDLRAWIGNANFVELAKDTTASGAPTIKQGVSHIGLSGVSPLGSDLWVDSTVGVGSASITTNAKATTAAIIATDGVLAAPSALNLVWPIAHDLTYSNTLIWIGSGLLLLAILAFLIAWRHARVKRGPRRRTPKAPRAKRVRVKVSKELTKGRGRRSARRNPTVGKIASIPAVLLLTVSLTGCSIQWPANLGGASDAKPTAKPSASASAPETPPAAVTRAQLERILLNVSDVVAAADKGNSKAVAAGRLAGPALTVRAVNYALRKKSNKVDSMQPIAAKPVTFSLPAATDTWPRTIMAVTDEPGQAVPPQMLILQQASPRENYKVWYIARLLPGASIPATPTEAQGAIPVDPASVFLKLAPNQVVNAFGDVINKGRSSLSASLFDLTNAFYTQVAKDQKNQAAELTNAKITFKHSLGEANVLALATADAGALVATYMHDTYVIKPKSAGAAVAVQGQEKILLGTGGSTTGVQSVYGDMLLFYVPPITSKGEIELLGVTQGLIAIKKL